MTTFDPKTATRDEKFRVALAAEPQLQAVDKVVRALVELVRDTDAMCTDCVWGDIVKPLAQPWIGSSRGSLPDEAEVPDPDRLPTPIPLGRLLAAPAARKVSATNEFERWLRTRDAFDAVTDTWLAQIYEADPANGHGIHRDYALDQD